MRTRLSLGQSLPGQAPPMTSCLPARSDRAGVAHPQIPCSAVLIASLFVACRRASAAGFGGASAAELAALRQQVAEQQSQLDQKDAMLQDLRDLLVGSQGCSHRLRGCSAGMPAAAKGCSARLGLLSRVLSD